MTAEQYLRELATAITRQEDLTDSEARKVLYELALRIYWLLLRELPASQFERYMRWPQIRLLMMPWLLEANDTLARLLFSSLLQIERELQAPITRYFRLPTGTLTPRPDADVLNTSLVVGIPVSQLFVRNNLTGISPFMAQLTTLLNRSITALFFKDAPTTEIAEKVVGVQIRAGNSYPVVTRGTVANGWRDRFRSITAAALWAPVTPTQERAATATATPQQWRWNAILDPATCVICRPLHRTTAPTPNAFPHGAPPLHPNCRCVVLPIPL